MKVYLQYLRGKICLPYFILLPVFLFVIFFITIVMIFTITPSLIWPSVIIIIIAVIVIDIVYTITINIDNTVYNNIVYIITTNLHLVPLLFSTSVRTMSLWFIYLCCHFRYIIVLILEKISHYSSCFGDFVTAADFIVDAVYFNVVTVIVISFAVITFVTVCVLGQ